MAPASLSQGTIRLRTYTLRHGANASARIPVSPRGHRTWAVRLYGADAQRGGRNSSFSHHTTAWRSFRGHCSTSRRLECTMVPSEPQGTGGTDALFSQISDTTTRRLCRIRHSHACRTAVQTARTWNSWSSPTAREARTTGLSRGSKLPFWDCHPRCTSRSGLLGVSVVTSWVPLPNPRKTSGRCAETRECQDRQSSFAGKGMTFRFRSSSVGIMCQGKRTSRSRLCAR